MAIVKRRCSLAKLNSNPVSIGPMPKLLTKVEIAKRLAKLDGWSYQGGFIAKQFEFRRFLDGIRFVNKVAAVAEEQEHHPDIQVRYTTVNLSLQTHSEDGVTRWDFELAAAIDRLPARGLTGGKRSK
jgi:4a-hydroxytetrahydrobiopterin dehydratase